MYLFHCNYNIIIKYRIKTYLEDSDNEVYSQFPKANKQKRSSIQ